MSRVLIREDGCWLWTGDANNVGYGKVRRNGKAHRAHRYAYEQLVGPIPEGLTLDHLCRVRLCVNPAHLEPVTLRENVMRGTSVTAINAKKTHCPRGHEYDRIYAGHRKCQTCDTIRLRNYRRKLA